MPFDFSAYQAVLLDLDGTIYKEDHPLAGAVELIHRLMADGRKIATVSNSTQSPRRIARRLSGMGVQMHPDLIFTASAEAVEYCLAHLGPMPRIFNLSTEGVQEMLDGKVIWVRDQAEPCDAVIVGNPACVWATVPRMRVALRLLTNGARCLGLCADRVYPGPDGLEIGSGAMTWMLAFAANVKPVFFGKPRPDFFLALCKRLNVDPARCILIGDNLESDIAGAKGVGMKTILTMGGVARPADLQGLSSDLQPDWVVQSLQEILDTEF